MAIGGGSGGAGGVAGAIRAGAAYVELFLKDNALAKSLNFWKEQIGKAGKVMAVAGAAALGVVGVAGGVALAALHPVVDTLGELRRMDDAGKALGLTARAASGLFGVLGQYSDLGENVEGLTQFNQKVQDAVSGVGGATGEAAKLFDGLSVSAQQLADLPLDEKFYRIHEAIRQLPQDQQQFKLSMLGGTDSMKKWLPLLSMSNAELRAQAVAMQFSAAEMEQASRASRAYERATGALHRAWQQVAIAVAPVVEQVSEAVEKAARWFVEWMKGRDAANIFAEVWVRIKIGLYEVQAWSEDVFGTVWDYFSDNAGSAIEVVKQLFTGLFSFAVGSFARIFPIWTKYAAIGVAAVLGTIASPMLALGMKEGQEIMDVAKGIDPGREAKRVAEMQEEGKKDLDAALKGFQEEREKFSAILKAKQGNMGVAAIVGGPLGLTAAGRAGERAEQRGALAHELAAVQAAAELQRRQAEVIEGMMPVLPPAVRDMPALLPLITNPAGTFGGGGAFLKQGYGSQGDGPAQRLKEMVKEQKETNRKLGAIEEAFIEMEPLTFGK